MKAHLEFFTKASKQKLKGEKTKDEERSTRKSFFESDFFHKNEKIYKTSFETMTTRKKFNRKMQRGLVKTKLQNSRWKLTTQDKEIQT